MVRKRFLGRKIDTSQREAFTMIELIFAIVIIAVVTLTIPMMIQVNNKTLEANTEQEAIFLISSVLSEATTLLWDQSSLGGTATSVSLSKILDTNATGAGEYERWSISDDKKDGNSGLRQGGLLQDMHRHFFSAPLAPSQSVLTDLGSSFDSDAVGAQLGLKNKYDIKVERYYIKDNPSGFNFTINDVNKTTNVKLIVVTVKNKDTKEDISVLRAYTCNIGEVDFARRKF